MSKAICYRIRFPILVSLSTCGSEELVSYLASPFFGANKS